MAGPGKLGRSALIAPAVPKPSPAARARAWAADAVARQTDRWILWVPVAFGGGCATYLWLKAEPAGWLLFVAAALALLGAWGVRRLGATALGVPTMLVAAFACGLVVARMRTDAVAAPVMPADLGVVSVEGWVVDVDSPGSRGARILVAPAWIEGLAPERTPHRVRIAVRGEVPAPGSAIAVRAVLNPPPAPASPGAYDFARDSFFRGVGGNGIALTQARDAVLQPPPWRLKLAMDVNAFRWRLAGRIVERLGEATGGIAAAMTTGHEAWIAPADTQVMRDSGLAHILSISGLHMVIVGGFVFFAVRLGVAAWPWLALRAPGKKIAAVAGLVAVWTYLVVSGAPPPAERAAMTATVAFFAILVDRRAITMNALAVAAMFVLLLQPETVAQPGFQMSFAATAALVALAEVWPQRIAEINAPWPIVLFQRTVAWVGAACAASLIAGLATGPFAIQHFNRTAVFGLFANLVVAPLSSFVIMPFLAIGAVLEVFGIGRWPLAVAGWGVEAMMEVGRFTAGLPGAVRVVASAPQAALVVAFLGVLFLCLWRGWGRVAGVPFALAVLLWPRPPAPDVWIASDGAAAVVRDGGEAVALRDNAKAFAADIWMRRRGLTASEPAGARAYLCKRFSCIPAVGAPVDLAAWWSKQAPKPQDLALLCHAGEIVILRATVEALPPACRGKLVLDGADFARGGSLELWERDGRWLGQWSAKFRGVRPWTGGTHASTSGAGHGPAGWWGAVVAGAVRVTSVRPDGGRRVPHHRGPERRSYRGRR